MTKKERLQTINSHVKGLKIIIEKNNIKLPAIVQIYLNRIQNISSKKYEPLVFHEYQIH